MKNPFTTTTHTIIGAAVILGAASFASRLIGILRDHIFANLFGAGNVMDAYYAAFRVPDFIYNLLIVGALSAGFIPVFTKLLTKDKDEAWRVTNSIVNLLFLALVILCGILFIFTPEITPRIVPGFDAEKIKLTAALTRVMLLSPIILGLSSIAGSVLQSFKNFLVFSLTPIMYNVGIIIGALYFVPALGTIGLAYGVILGALLHLIIQLPALFRLGYKYQNIWQWKNPAVREISFLMIPRMLGLAIGQINLIVITVLASTLSAGSVAVFNLANNLQYFPIGIIGVSFAIAAFPTLSQLSAENKKEEMIASLSHTIRQILFFIIPLTIIFLLLRAQIVRVTLGSGQFDWNDTITTADTLAFFSFSLFAQSLIYLLARGFYALHNTWTPLWIGIVSAVVNVAAGIYLKTQLGVLGLALAFSLSAILQMALLWIALRHKLGTLNETSILNSLYKISVGAIAMALVIQLLKYPLASIVDMNKFWGISTQGAVAGLSGLLIYGLICHLLKLEEVENFVMGVRRRMGLREVSGEVEENK